MWVLEKQLFSKRLLGGNISLSLKAERFVVMTIADRWLLPDGMTELLPPDAQRVETLRRELLDLFHRWGYELVMPPMVEYLESLLTGAGAELDLQTFKVTDQLTGRLMGVRADIAPQVARIDAHSYRQGSPTRLCYAGGVLHAKAASLLSSRSPIQVGAELYGDQSLESDLEIISLMISGLHQVQLNSLHVELGHVGIYRQLAKEAGLPKEIERSLFSTLQQKSLKDIEDVLAKIELDEKYRSMFLALPRLNGGQDCLIKAREVFATASSDILVAIGQLEVLSHRLQARFPELTLSFDLSELRGFQYHTGLVFAAFAPSHGEALAKGGRYDGAGEAFGRARPATGFSTDLRVVLDHIVNHTQALERQGILAPEIGDDEAFGNEIWEQIQALRDQGERVVARLPGQIHRADELGCDRELVKTAQGWEVVSLQQ